MRPISRQMATWHNLAGYLTLRPAGALSRLKVRKRFWYVLDEKKGHLVYYRSESDALDGKERVGVINVRGAAISLALEENNQFVIHSDGKEYVLVADNHESMMLWVLALQAKQDPTDKKIELSKGMHREDNATIPDSKFKMENGETINKSKILRTHSLQLHDKSRQSDSQRNLHNPLTRMRSLLTTGHIGDSFVSSSEKTHSFPKSQLSSVVQNTDDENEDNVCANNCSSSSSNTSSTSTSPVVPGLANSTSTSSPGFRDSKLNNENLFECPVRDSAHSDSDEDSSKPATAIQSTIGISSISSERLSLLRKISSEGMKADPLKDRASSLSGTSVSSDSAVGISDCAHSVRIHELESKLTAAKCDLAKALNRESAYKCIIEEKINLVAELEDRLKIADVGADDGGKVLSPTKCTPPNSASSVKRLQEKCRILQNHNRFLNEEVLKLSKMLQQEQSKSHLKQLQILRMERENDQLKRDYVFLLQSSLKIINTDGPETLEVFMYGEARHKQRVLTLLEEARKINPTLPAYENLTRSMCHVDSLGFRRQCGDEGLVLHYICRQLHQHYSTLSPGYELHQQKWKRYLRQHGTLARTKELKILVRGGIPGHLRSRVWVLLYKSQVADLMEDKGSHYYNYLCSLAPDDERVSQHRRQIALDLLRTMPDNIRFSDSNADGVRKMQEVLQAFCLHNTALGYCQGMNFLVGMLLLFLEPEDAFWCLVAITERYFTPNYFDQNLIGAQADQEVFKDLIKERMPMLWRHLARIDIELCTVTLNWFLAIFFDCVPFETLLRIWDCFLLEGPKVLFRFALAILTLNEKSLLMRNDTVSIMRQLKAAARLCFDVESLFKTAFETLKPFTRRQDIAAKQACYYKTLKEHAKKVELEKDAIKDKEKMLSEMEKLNANQLVIECAAMYDKDKLWLCHGHQNGAQISKVNCEENIMYRLNIEFESRVMCMHALDDETMLLGTLSHFVYAYSTRARRLLWEIRLNNSVLALGSHEEDGMKQVYAGLSDGTVAVIENVRNARPKPEAFYIFIGSSPVTCISLVNRRLWCGCGNRVIILNARTMDTVDQFQTSSNVLDYISMLVPEEHGVWVTIRGSSVLQLWDAQNLTCKLLFDVKDSRYPKPLKQYDEDSSINSARITAVLPFGGSVLVGTAEGILIIYDIVARLSRSASCADFASKRQFEATTGDHIQERIQELLTEQNKRDEEEEESIFERDRSRTDSGCYSTQSRTSLNTSSRRESQHVSSDATLPAQMEDIEDLEDNSPEDRSEATSACTILPAAADFCASTPESQISEEHDSLRTLVTKVDDKDSGRSSSSTQDKVCDDGEELTNDAKKLCTCHQLSSKTTKCRHCLLETSEALRQLFSKYSLGTTQTNNPESTVKSNPKLLDDDTSWKSICEPGKVWNDQGEKDSPSKNELSSELRCFNSKESMTHQLNNNNSAETTAINNNVAAASPPRFRRRFNSATATSTRTGLFRAISADDVSRWVRSQENLSSSLGSDSYDFDDVFVTYTEDEGDRAGSWLNHPPRTGLYHNKETEALLESIRARALSRRRSSNICDYTINTSLYGTDQCPSSWLNWKSRCSSPWTGTSVSSLNPPLVVPSSPIARPRLLDIRTQLPPWALTSDSDKAPATRLVACDKSDETSPNEWLSYEDSITENDSSVSRLAVVNKDLLHLGDFSSSTQKGSDTASNVSFCSTDVPYTFELNLQEKIKISDKPIKCFLETRCSGEPTIISCAGCYGDDEAVLKWTKLGDEKLWTNDPIIEVCPYTNAIKPSLYARSRLPCRSTPLASTTSEPDLGSRNALISVVTTPGSVMGSGLAKVQNMLQRVHDKV